MFGLLESLTKAAVGVALAPVAVAADLLSLPSTAVDGKPAFGVTELVVKSVGRNLVEAVRPLS